jgi:multisubunit Na+/H+ antiporter MnhC subunit
MNGPPSASVQPPEEPAPAEADLARIQAERDAPRSEHERIKKPRRRRIRRSVVGLLVALSCLLVLLSTTEVWVHRTLLNTPAFVGTVAPVFENPAVASAVAARATDELFTELNVQARLRDALPPRASFAAVPVTNATKGFVAGQLTSVLTSSQFQAAWTAALTFTHQQLVAVLRGQNTAAVSTSGGYIVLNTVPVINQALGKVSGLASDLTGKPVTLPAITSADPPQQAVNKLSGALGVPLPSNFGQITLVRSSDLATVQKGVKAFDRLTLVLPLVTIALIALSLWLSLNRRRTVLQLAVGISLLMIVERRVVIHEQGALASAAHNPQLAQNVLGDLLHGFFVLTAWVLGVALVVVVIAVLSGPYRWAVGIRSRVKRTGRSIAEARSSDRRSQMITWMASHAAGLQLAGALVAGILLLIVPVSWLGFLIIGVLLAAYEIYLQRIKSPPPDEPPPTPGPGNQAGPPSRISETSGQDLQPAQPAR